MNDAPTVDLDDDTPTNQTDLERVVRLSRLQVTQERDLEENDEKGERIRAALRRTREVDLPEALAIVGLSSITLDSGEAIEIVREIFAGIPKGKEDEAFAWFTEAGHGDLIKHEISIKLPKGQQKTVERIKRSLRKFNATLKDDTKFDLTDKETIHHQTLQKFVRDAENAGRDDLPEDLLGIFRRRVTKVVHPEEKSF